LEQSPQEVHKMACLKMPGEREGQPSGERQIVHLIASLLLSLGSILHSLGRVCAPRIGCTLPAKTTRCSHAASEPGQEVNRDHHRGQIAREDRWAWIERDPDEEVCGMMSLRTLVSVATCRDNAE
jgi:hypothetical protein